MITKLRKFIQKLSQTKKYDKYFLYSQIIKTERAKRKLTLAEMSKGICSVSYLCKFEKNDIIADESYIRAIFERVNIDFNLVGRNILKNGVENTLKAYLANDYEEIELIKDSIDDTIFNAQNYIIKCFYYLINKRYSEFNECIKALDNIKDTLLIDDVGVFLFLVTQYYMDTNQYFEASNIIKESEQLKFNVDELNWLLTEQKFKVAFHLKDYPQMFYYYNQILQNNCIGYPWIRKVFSRVKYLYADAESNFQRAFQELEKLNMKNIPEDYQNELNYWKIAIYIKGGMYLKAFDEINDYNLYYDSRFIGLILLSAYYIGDENYINIACDIANEYQPDNKYPQDDIFIRFMLLFLKGKYKHEYIEYLKERILNNKNNFSHFIYYPFYLKKYTQFLKKSSRYKEAFTILYDKYVE